MARTPRSQKKGAPSPRKKGAAPRKAGAATYNDAMSALEGVAVIKQEFGRLNKDGTANIDTEKLEELKRTLGEVAWSKVRFVALNAPFKRRTQIPQA
jgi:hypothetical protein